MGRLDGSDSCLHTSCLNHEDTLIHPTGGTAHSFPGAEMLEFRDMQASLDSVMPG